MIRNNPYLDSYRGQRSSLYQRASEGASWGASWGEWPMKPLPEGNRRQQLTESAINLARHESRQRRRHIH